MLASAILCLVLGGLYLLVVAPVLDFYAQREAMLTDRQMLAPRLSAAAGELSGLRTRLAELNAAASSRRITLDGRSDSIASANLQSRTEELATSAGVTIGSTEGLTAESRGGYNRIGLRVAVSGEYEAIVKLITGIEMAAPPLVLGTLQIHGVLRPNGEPTHARLDANFEVYGFRDAETPVALKQ